MKPAEQTPLTCLRLARLAQKAGIPDGVINVVPGYGPTAGAAIVKHPGVDKVAFTGEHRTAQIIMRDARQTLKRLTFELGGKSPNIVFADADLDAAVAGSHVGLYLNQGQCCCAGSRVFVQEKVYDKFIDKLAAMNKSRKLGDPFDPETAARPADRPGPVRQDHALHRPGQEAKGPSASAAASGSASAAIFIEPTLFADVNDDMSIAKDEIFGPVMSVLRVQGRRRDRRAGQQHVLWPGRRRLDARHRQGPSPGRRNSGRHGVDQLLRRVRRRGAVRRLQDVGHGPRTGRKRAGSLHREQDRHGQPGLTRGRPAREWRAALDFRTTDPPACRRHPMHRPTIARLPWPCSPLAAGCG